MEWLHKTSRRGPPPQGQGVLVGERKNRTKIEERLRQEELVQRVIAVPLRAGDDASDQSNDGLTRGKQVGVILDQGNTAFDQRHQRLPRAVQWKVQRPRLRLCHTGKNRDAVQEFHWQQGQAIDTDRRRGPSSGTLSTAQVSGGLRQSTEGAIE